MQAHGAGPELLPAEALVEAHAERLLVVPVHGGLGGLLGRCFGAVGLVRIGGLLTGISPLGLLLPALVRVLLGLARVVDLVGPVEGQHDRGRARLQAVRGLVGLASANDHDPEPELLTQVEPAVDVSRALRDAGQGRATVEQRPGRLEVGVVGGTGHRLARLGTPQQLAVVLGVHEELPQVGEVAHERRGVASAGRAEGRVLHEVRCEHEVARREVAGDHQAARSGEEGPGRRGRKRAEAGLRPLLGGVRLEREVVGRAPGGLEALAVRLAHVDAHTLAGVHRPVLVDVHGPLLEARVRSGVHEGGGCDEALPIDDPVGRGDVLTGGLHALDAPVREDVEADERRVLALRRERAVQTRTHAPRCIRSERHRRAK